MSASSSFRIEGSWRAARVALIGLSMLAGWALTLSGLDTALAVLVWGAVLGHGLWAARWSLRAHAIEPDGADGLQLVWSAAESLPLVQVQTYGPCWLLHAAGSQGDRRAAALAVLWPALQRREFRRRWALRRTDPMPRDSAPNV